ncbi:IFM1 protein, partial [Regulus satrapa]|nr:IFM1 protein [Regulus satrapa]
CPRARGMQQLLPPYEVLLAEVSMEALPRSTTLLLEEMPQPPRDHLVWSLFTTLHGSFCCLGAHLLPLSPLGCPTLVILTDDSGALSYGSTAKYLNITALVISIIVVVIIVVTLIAAWVIESMNAPHPSTGRTHSQAPL